MDNKQLVSYKFSTTVDGNVETYMDFFFYK